MDTNLTLTKLKGSLEHNYVQQVADYLILAVKRGNSHEKVILDKPFEEKIESICKDHNEDCTLIGSPHVKILSAQYTTRRHLDETLLQIHNSLQN